jgi:hypothetical protein
LLSAAVLRIGVNCARLFARLLVFHWNNIYTTFFYKNLFFVDGIKIFISLCSIIKMMVNEKKFAEKDQFYIQKNGKTRSAEHLRILYYYSSQCLFIFESRP